MSVPPEIGPGYHKGGILLVGRDPGSREVQLGRPFVGPAGQLLDECLLAAGIRRENVAITNIVSEQPPGNVFERHHPEAVERGRRDLASFVDRLQPNLVVALGNEASWTLVGEGVWPSTGRGVYGATGILERRGYFWRGSSDVGGAKVLTTLHPSYLARMGEGGEEKGAKFGINAAIGKMLFTYDLERGHHESHYASLNRPIRDVRIISTSRDAFLAGREIRRSGLVGVDIENADARSVSCIGFAPSESVAYVFTPVMLTDALSLLTEDFHKVFHNGQYDCYFLLTRHHCEVRGFTDDTSIAFHANWPELAGAAEGGGKRTHKSLRFLASLYTLDEFWKNYDFASEEEEYILNGRDCCVTLSCNTAIAKERKELDTETIYHHEIRLIWPLIRIEERGLLVDEEARRSAIDALSGRVVALGLHLATLARPILETERAKIERQNLFWRPRVCKVCRNGSKKRLSCESCKGIGKWEEFAFNPNSDEQVKILLYDVLKLPKRYRDGKLTTDESALKSLLGTLN